MATIATNSTTLLSLPYEIRHQILQNLLLVKRAPRHGVVNCKRPNTFHCEECEAQNPEHGRMFPETQVLQVCHQLCDEGRSVIRENQLISVTARLGISQDALDRVNLGCWAFSPDSILSVQPIMAFQIHNGREPIGPSLGSVCFFLLQDIDRVARFLSNYSGQLSEPDFRHDSVSLRINRIHVPGFCTSLNAADLLILEPFWPWLNGQIQKIEGYGFEITCQLKIDSPSKYVIRKQPGLSTNLAQYNFASKLFKRISQFQATVQAPFGPWDLREAKSIFENNWSGLFDLACNGKWESDFAWDSIIHEDCHFLDDQVNLQRLNNFGPGHCEYFLWNQSWFRFLAAIISVHLAYTTPSAPAEIAQRQSNASKNLKAAWKIIADEPTFGYQWERSEYYYQTLLYFEVLATRSSKATLLSKKILLLVANLKPDTAAPVWEETQATRLLELMNRYKGAEGSAKRWKKDGMFRAAFFRWYTKTELVPLIEARFGKEDGEQWRDAVPLDILSWKKAYLEEKGNDITGEW